MCKTGPVALLLVVLATFLPSVPQSQLHAQALNQLGNDCYTFVETGESVCGKFRAYFEEQGGLAQFGYPISDVRSELSDQDGTSYPVQYFERAAFELHLNNIPPYDVQLTLLGASKYKQKYPNGAPSQVPNTNLRSLLFQETGKRLGGWFQEYWEAHGGVTRYGYPVSDEFVEQSELDGKKYLVQYFERAVFELHPENDRANAILLAQLGMFHKRAATKLSPGLREEFRTRSEVLYLVVLTEQADTSNDITDWEEKGRYVGRVSSEVAARTQPPIAAFLSEHEKAGNIERFHSYLIINGFGVKGNLTSARALAALPQTGSVEAMPRIGYDD